MAEERGVKFVGNGGGVDQLAETLRQAATQTDPTRIQVNFCGPKGLMSRVRELMRENGIPEGNLHYEFF